MNDQMREKSVLTVGWLTLFIIGTDLFVVSPLLPLISQRFSIAPSTAGWMVAAFSITYAIGAPWLGSIADRIGKRRMIVIGLLGFSIGNALTGLASSFSLLVASRVVTGLSAAAVTPSIYAITGDVAPAERRGGWLAIVGSGLLIALWAGTPIGTLVSQFAGWKVVFLGLAIVSLSLGFLNQKVWRENDKTLHSVAHKNITQSRQSVCTVLIDVSVMTIWGIAVYGVYAYLGTILRLDDHFAPALVAIALLVYGIGATTGSLSGGRFTDRWGASRVSTLSLVGLAILLGVASLLFKSGLWLFPLFLLWAFAGYAFFPAFQSRLAQKYDKNRGMAMAWNNTALYVGITLGSLLGGWIITTWDVRVLPLICGAIALLGSLVNFIRTNLSKTPKSAPSSKAID